ncbi:hypothetical protein KRMM14A1259_27670 [Krasilnikovia sp. MM14-A1259]
MSAAYAATGMANAPAAIDRAVAARADRDGRNIYTPGGLSRGFVEQTAKLSTPGAGRVRSAATVGHRGREYRPRSGISD